MATTTSAFQVDGSNAAALFTLKVHRGEGMVLLAMNWKAGTPTNDFVGFAIEYKEPGGNKFYVVKNRIAFPDQNGQVNPNIMTTRLSPIQKFRWVHFPHNANLKGAFTYRVTPVFMNSKEELSYGDAQEVNIELQRETYPGQLNVTFTRGFVASQAFVDDFTDKKDPSKSISNLLPDNAIKGLTFVPTHPQANEALAWMGFEARNAIFDVLDKAIADPAAQVRVIAYDLNEPEIVNRLEQLGARLKIIIDNSGDHGKPGSGENQAADLLSPLIGAANLKRQHMGKLQHNKTIVVDGPNTQLVVCGSTNLSWRGLYVQSNNAVVLTGTSAVKPFREAFEHYWMINNNDPKAFGNTASAQWSDLKLKGINAEVSFSPHLENKGLLGGIADDISQKTTSNLFYSLAFLYEPPGPILDAIKQVTSQAELFVYGISDREVGGLDLQKPNGNIAPVFPSELSGNLPAPFKAEPTGGKGIRMHHKFVVIDFNKPTARVYLGSYNFSSPADISNGENLLFIRDQRIAVAYMIEALRIFDHYHFRVAQDEFKQKQKATAAAGNTGGAGKKTENQITLVKPPKNPGDKPWWDEYFTDALKIQDRMLFS